MSDTRPTDNERTDSGSTFPTAEQEYQPDKSLCVLDRQALEMLRSLGGTEQDGILGKIIRIYCDDTPKQIESLRSAIEAGDSETVRTVSHSLKSSSANLGAVHLTELFKALEIAGRQKDMKEVVELFNRVESVYATTSRLLKAELTEPSL